MKQLLTKTIGFFFAFALIAQLFVNPLIVSAQTQPTPAPAAAGADARCSNPQFAAANQDICTAEVGGLTLTADSIRGAINSPTPNLANTTAYVFYTISILLTGTFDPNYETADVANDGVTPESSRRSSIYANADYPGTLAEALGRRGAIGGVGFLMAELISNPPASAQTYVADLIDNSRFTGTPVYAQGIGFGALNPILGTWKAFRDVAYYLLTIMFLVTGFLILIRHKVSGNVAVTVQNALPKLVITLILITFSYAIAGLIVDLMFLALYFVISIFDGQIFVEGGQNLREIAFDTHIFSFTVSYIFGGDAWSAADAVANIIFSAIETMPIIGAIAGLPLISNLFQTITAVVFTLIFAIALLIAMFRTFFSLLMSYAGFIINVVLSPFILLTGAIPGRDPWKNWIKNLIGGLAPFVVAVFMIFMALALTGRGTANGIGYEVVDGNVEGLRLPLIMGGVDNASALLGVLAMGFMLLLPEAVKMTKDTLGTKGGVFESFKDSAVGNLKQGWKGNEYLPGGKQLAVGAGMGAAASVGGGAVGGYEGGRALGQRLGGKTGGRIGGVLGGVGGTIGGAALGATGIPSVVGATLSGGGFYKDKGGKAIDMINKSDNAGVKLAREYVNANVTGARENIVGHRIGVEPSAGPVDPSRPPTVGSGAPADAPPIGVSISREEV